MEVRNHEIAERPGVARIAATFFKNWKARRQARPALPVQANAAGNTMLSISASAIRTASRLD